MRKTSNERNIVRAMILSANDGLLSNFSIVMGMAGTEINSVVVILTGLIGILAGSVSMALGEYTSVDATTTKTSHNSPLAAAVYSFISFATGSFIPIIPFFFPVDGHTASVISAILVLNCLFSVGLVNAGRRHPIMSGLRQAFFGLISALLTYGLGHLLGVQILG